MSLNQFGYLAIMALSSVVTWHAIVVAPVSLYTTHYIEDSFAWHSSKCFLTTWSLILKMPSNFLNKWHGVATISNARLRHPWYKHFQNGCLGMCLFPCNAKYYKLMFLHVTVIYRPSHNIALSTTTSRLLSGYTQLDNMHHIIYGVTLVCVVCLNGRQDNTCALSR
jgi:hypothetical protein